MIILGLNSMAQTILTSQSLIKCLYQNQECLALFRNIQQNPKHIQYWEIFHHIEKHSASVQKYSAVLSNIQPMFRNIQSGFSKFCYMYIFRMLFWWHLLINIFKLTETLHGEIVDLGWQGRGLSGVIWERSFLGYLGKIFIWKLVFWESKLGVYFTFLGILHDFGNKISLRKGPF